MIFSARPRPGSNSHWLPMVSALFLAALLAVPAAAETVSPPLRSPQVDTALGEVVSDEVSIDGAWVPSGTTLWGDSLVGTGGKPGLVHLKGGRVLWLESHSKAYLGTVAFSQETRGSSDVRLDVRAGQVRLRGPREEDLTLSQDATMVLADFDAPSGDLLASTRLGAQDSSLGAGAEVGAPVISDAKKACLPDSPYPLVDASIRPGSEVRVAKVYFRAVQHPDFYVVEMTNADLLDGFEAALPAPAPGTRQVVYYVEAVAQSFESSRTPEYIADVVETEECRRRGGAGIVQGAPPSVLSTVPGAPPVPPGFLPSAVAPAATAGGGGGFGIFGLGTGGTIGVIAGGVIGGILIFEELDDNDERAASPVTP